MMLCQNTSDPSGDTSENRKMIADISLFYIKTYIRMRKLTLPHKMAACLLVLHFYLVVLFLKMASTAEDSHSVYSVRVLLASILCSSLCLCVTHLKVL